MWLGGEVEGLDAAGAANEAEGEQDQVEDVTRKAVSTGLEHENI